MKNDQAYAHHHCTFYYSAMNLSTMETVPVTGAEHIVYLCRLFIGQQCTNHFICRSQMWNDVVLARSGRSERITRVGLFPIGAASVLEGIIGCLNNPSAISEPPYVFPLDCRGSVSLSTVRTNLNPSAAESRHYCTILNMGQLRWVTPGYNGAHSWRKPLELLFD